MSKRTRAYNDGSYLSRRVIRATGRRGYDVRETNNSKRKGRK